MKEGSSCKLETGNHANCCQRTICCVKLNETNQHSITITESLHLLSMLSIPYTTVYFNGDVLKNDPYTYTVNEENGRVF